MSSDRSEDDALSRVWVEAWQADVAEPLRVRRAYQRCLASRSRVGDAGFRSAPLLGARWVLLGIVVGASSLFAASRASDWLAPAPPAVRAPSSAPALQPPGQANGLTTSTAPPALLSADEPKALPPAAQSASPRAIGAASEPELWQRAARGLRDEDFDSANAALADLIRQGTTSERESARLVQAQVLLAQGRGQEAELLLRELASTGQSAKVRQKSRELLPTSQENRSSHGSFSPAGGANEP